MRQCVSEFERVTVRRNVLEKMRRRGEEKLKTQAMRRDLACPKADSVF